VISSKKSGRGCEADHLVRRLIVIVGISSLPSYASVESTVKTSPLIQRWLFNSVDCVVSNGVIRIVGIKENCVGGNAPARSWMDWEISHRMSASFAGLLEGASGYSIPPSTIRPRGLVSAELMCHSVFQLPWTPRQVLLVRFSRSHRLLGIVLRQRRSLRWCVCFRMLSLHLHALPMSAVRCRAC